MSVIDRSRAEKVLYRTAISAFMYYPDKADNEPGYDVEEDVAWCAAPLERRLPSPDVEMFRGIIRMLITEPLADRRPLIQKLAELSGE
ncbi:MULTISPECIES: hypothetical protein [Microbacterium]|uniref:Uncharacterized protein n=1 Tax=Microbacterium imperiale TaxID=33884 RepID=A0A9W6HHX3_9MICO|nr:MULTISPECIES: hypothetical protein [Microbacterium]MBP2421535.1 hypothetical protein [Microbacterium imperiale]MDD7928803.1 hypothetical protein [Microbacterium thalli]MDS0199358.1 hypothetical protein [Microbacterium imperiale]BFE41874.1 hypothetical protein GCM10017544_28300 [Microbacterium imperiale]GLJ80826.1 hypothetical protein GCM10017586_25090 [Microbacterium imperiale]